MQLTTRNRGPAAGFTLIELLIALVIIGLLVGVVGPALFKNVGKSEVTTAKAQIDALIKAIDQFRLETGHYPSNEQGLVALVERPAGEAKWNGPYLKKAVPLDPWGRPYRYASPGSHSADYDVYSLGQDGAAGGENENADLGSW